MTLAKNKLVPVQNGFMVCYEDRSWLSSSPYGDAYWAPNNEDAMVIRSKFVAVLVAKFWDIQRARADKENGT